jgi:hypothetical protein
MLAVLAVAAIPFAFAFAPSALAAGSSQITGTVTSAVTNAPLDGVEVCEYPDEGGAGSVCAQTDSKGNYVLEVGRAGTFVVHFDTTVEGLIPQTFYKGVFVNREATRVQVAEGETVSGIDEAIEEGGHITGRVRNKSTKTPIEGVQACAELPDVDQSGVEPHRTCATTNAGGEYEIEGLTPGEGEPEGGYAVEFTSTLDYIKQFYGGGLENYSSTLIPIVLGETVPNIDAELEEGGEISGRVTSQVNGQPVAGARACAGGTAVRTICATTDTAGEYTIGQLMSGEYTVSFGGPSGLETEYIGQDYKEKEWPNVEAVSVTAPGKVTGIDASLKARGGIAGVVTSKLTHEPIAGVNVCTESQTQGGSYETCENTNSKGEYQIHGLLAGNYALAFWATRTNEEGSNYLSQPHGYATNPQANSVSVAMGSTTTADDELVAGGRISGEVTNVKTKQPAGGWPCVEDLSQPDPHLAQTCALSMSEGKYTISGLQPGEYRVVFANDFSPGDEFYKQYWNHVSSESEATPVVISEGSSITGIDAALEARKPYYGEGIEGRVLEAGTNARIKGIEVCAYETSGGADLEGLYGSCTETNAAGEYALLGLSASTYVVEFSTPFGSEVNYVTSYFNEAASAAATPITIEAHTIRTEIDASLDHGGRVTGRVISAATGTPIDGIVACALGMNTESVGCAATNRNGEYAMSGLATGSYAVGFAAPPESGLNYLKQYYSGQSSASTANPVTVRVEETTSGIDVQLVTSASGPPVVHQPPPVFTAPVPASLPLAAVTPSSTPANIGTETGLSSTSVPTPSANGSSGPLVVLASRVLVSGASASVNVKCDEQACHGSVELVMQIVTRSRKAGRLTSHTATLVLARGSFSLTQGSSAAVALRLTDSGKKRLAHAGRHPIPVGLTFDLPGEKPTTKPVLAS